MLTTFSDIKGIITINFFEKCVTVNSAYYYLLLWQNSSFLLNNPCKYIIYIQELLKRIYKHMLTDKICTYCSSMNKQWVKKSANTDKGLLEIDGL